MPPNRRARRRSTFRIPSPELLAKLASDGYLRVDALQSDPRSTIERCTLRRGHVLGAPASPEELARWDQDWPAHPLPTDLAELLRRANGIHLWADFNTGRSYEGLAPMHEWRLARHKMWGDDADPSLLSDRYVALSYHADASAFAVLNFDSGRYFLMDSCGADETSPIGSGVDDLLEWLWEHRIP